MRKINRIVIHCTATEKGQDVSVADITDWHKARGFSTIGYHFVVQPNGFIDTGRDLRFAGAHAKGYNKDSIGIAYVGGYLDGVTTDTRTPEQKSSLIGIITGFKAMFGQSCEVVGHRDLSVDLNEDGVIDESEWMKECPCFSVETEL